MEVQGEAPDRTKVKRRKAHGPGESCPPAANPYPSVRVMGSGDGAGAKFRVLTQGGLSASAQGGNQEGMNNEW